MMQRDLFKHLRHHAKTDLIHVSSITQIMNGYARFIRRADLVSTLNVRRGLNTKIARRVVSGEGCVRAFGIPNSLQGAPARM